MSTIPQNEPGTDVEDEPPVAPESPVEVPDVLVAKTAQCFCACTRHASRLSWLLLSSAIILFISDGLPERLYTEWEWTP